MLRRRYVVEIMILGSVDRMTGETKGQARTPAWIRTGLKAYHREKAQDLARVLSRKYWHEGVVTKTRIVNLKDD